MSQDESTYPQHLMLNVIPLLIEPGSQKISFFKEKPGNGDAVLLKDHSLPKRLMGYGKLYTDFSVHSDADLSMSIPLAENSYFAQNYVKHQLFEWFDGKASIRSRNFVRDVEVYFEQEERSIPNFRPFHRFTLKIYYKRFTDGFELGVSYNGTMQMWEKSVLNYEGNTEDITKVVYDEKLYRYEELRDSVQQVDYEKVFPVLNRTIAKELNLPPKKWSRENKLKQHTAYIHKFYKKWINEEGFRKQFKPSDQGFKYLDEAEVHHIDPEKSKLRFGNQNLNYDPMQGLKKHGPYRLPDASHLDLFIIVPENDAKTTGNTLFKALKEGKGAFPGLSKFARFPINTSDHNITFSRLDDPLPEIREKLTRMDFDPSKNYGAIYISPFEKDDPDPKKQLIYYRIKELLLQYRITSQVITKSSINNSSFGYYLPNIATALIAKLGGTPWTLDQKDRKELIIGIGAYRPKKLDETYLGSAFCFLNDGTFKGFDSFAKNDMLKLAGSFQMAISKFRKEHPEVERIVLHFYKRISNKESRVLRNALREMKLDIPMVIVTIYKSGSKDLVITDTKQKHALPLSGTWFQSGRNQFLLCNNTRIPDSKLKIKSYPFPLKLFIDVVRSGEEQREQDPLLNDKEWVQELLTQVYQFSRLNWQTVSIKDIPVSIAYPEMVAEKYPYFEGGKIPDFGKENFWFL